MVFVIAEFVIAGYQTAVHLGEQPQFAPVGKDEEREGAPTSRDPGDD